MKTYKQFVVEAWIRRSQRKSKKEGLTPTKQRDNRPEAFVTVGIPASGKTSMVGHMQTRNPRIGHHELDKSRKALGKQGGYYGPDLVQHYQAGIEADAKKGNPIVVSNTSLPKAHRTSAVRDLEKLGYNTKVVALPSSEKAAVRRNRRRMSDKVPEFVMRHMRRQFHGINTRPNTGGALSRADRRAARREFKQLHKKYRFTKPAMRRSGVIR